MKEEILDRTLCRTRFGGIYGSVVRQSTGKTHVNSVEICTVELACNMTEFMQKAE
jgi:hypothetical protein